MFQAEFGFAALLALVMLVSPGCRSSGTANSNPTVTSARQMTMPATLPTPYLDPNSIPSDLKITLSRTTCYGACPAYKVEIYGNGRVVFEGQRHVKKEGTVTWQINDNRIKQLISEFNNINYFSLSDSYSLLDRKDCPNFATDAPSVTTSITINGQTKTVFHSRGCHDSEVLSKLEAFEDRIDELSDAKRRIE
jgi:hypothetical protein